MYRRRQENKSARQEQDLLRSELQVRERVFQAAYWHSSQELGELKKVTELCMEEFSRRELRINFAVRNYRTFPVNLQLFRVLVERLAATVVCDQIHGGSGIHQETFLKLRRQHMDRLMDFFFGDASSNKIRWLGIRRCWNNWNQRLRSGKRHETNSEIFKKVVHWESFVAHRKGFIHEWLRNKDSNCRSCILTKFPIPSTFSSWKTSFKTEVCACPGSPSEAILWSKKWRWLVHWNTSNHHARFRGKISRIRDARCEDCIRTEQDHPEPLPQEEGESGRAESSNARSISSRTTDRLPSWFTSISEQLAFMILFSTVQIYSASLSEVTMCRNSCNMGRHVLPMSKIPPDDVLESLYKLRIHESNQLKAVFELYDLGSHQKNSKLDYQKWKTMVKRSIALNIRPQIYHARNVRMETGAAAKSHMLSVESERTVFKRRQWQVPSPLQ